MQTRLKHGLRIASIVVGMIVGITTIIVGIITIWQWLKPSYKLEAAILETRAPLSQELKNNLNELGDFSVSKIRKGYKDAPELNGVSDSHLEKVLPIFSKIIKDKVEFIMDFSLPRKEYLTVVTIHNFGDQTLTGVELRNRLSTIKMIAQIERGGGKQDAIEFSGNLIIGNLSPRSEITVYIYSLFPFMFDEQSSVIAHDRGVGKISFYRPVPKLVTQTSGIFISYYWTSIVLAIFLIFVFMFFMVRWLKQRRLKTGDGLRGR